MKKAIILAIGLLAFGCSKEPLPESAAEILATKGDSCGSDRNTWTWEQGGFPRSNQIEFECKDGTWRVSRFYLREPSAALVDGVIKAIRAADVKDPAK